MASSSRYPANSRYPAKPTSARLALLPGLLGAIVLIAALALIGNASWYVWVQYAVAILAAICCVFAWQGHKYFWLIGLVPIVVLFNPVFPITLPNVAVPILHLAAAIVLIAAGITITVPTEKSDAAKANTAKQGSGTRTPGTRTPGSKGSTSRQQPKRR
jgi:phosphoglycerol transferase MdoB-like AlkP superfamily enzyme